MTSPTSEPTASAAPADPIIDREATNPHLHWLVHFGIPAGVSVALHLALFAALALITWTVADRARPTNDIPIGLTDVSGQGGAFEWPDHLAIPDVDPATDGASRANATGDLREIADALIEIAAKDADNPDTGGFGVGEGASAAVLGLGGGGTQSGSGGGLGSGFGQVGGLGGAGLWRMRVRGNSFVYVVDYSGSIIPVVEDLERELKRSIGRLANDQAFNVIVYQTKSRTGQVVADAFQSKLEPARTETKRSFFSWLSARQPDGSSQEPALLALRRALAMKPEVIFFFSDGLLPEPDEVLSEIGRLNRDRATQIHCLLFDDGVLGAGAASAAESVEARFLRKLAESNGGGLTIVTSRDLFGEP